MADAWAKGAGPCPSRIGPNARARVETFARNQIELFEQGHAVDVAMLDALSLSIEDARLRHRISLAAMVAETGGYCVLGELSGGGDIQTCSASTTASNSQS